MSTDDAFAAVQGLLGERGRRLVAADERQVHELPR